MAWTPPPQTAQQRRCDPEHARGHPTAQCTLSARLLNHRHNALTSMQQHHTGCWRCLAAVVYGLGQGAEDSRSCNIRRSSSSRECLTGPPMPHSMPSVAASVTWLSVRAGGRPDAAERHLPGGRLKPRGRWLRICPAGAGVPVLSHLGVGLGVLLPSLQDPAH